MRMYLCDAVRMCVCSHVCACMSGAVAMTTTARATDVAYAMYAVASVRQCHVNARYVSACCNAYVCCGYA